jgi:hypothetical protein
MHGSDQVPNRACLPVPREWRIWQANQPIAREERPSLSIYGAHEIEWALRRKAKEFHPDPGSIYRGHWPPRQGPEGAACSGLVQASLAVGHPRTIGS